MIKFGLFEPKPHDNPCQVVFTWAASPNGGSQTLSVFIENGDYAGIIEVVKSSGGAYLPSDHDTIVFYPWPPLHVEIDLG
jgi:hypothetical protein